MKYDLKRPCADCPFRSDIRAYLHPDRAREIGEGLLYHNYSFSCHKTTTSVGKDNHDKNAQHCAGALIFCEKNERPHQMMRIAERIGMYDYKKLDMESPMFDTLDDFIDAQDC